MLCVGTRWCVGADEQSPMTPEQRMQARFPQPVRVGDLIGMPLLDDSAATLGYVREIVRTEDGKMELIVDYGGFLQLAHSVRSPCPSKSSASPAGTLLARHAAERICGGADLAATAGSPDARLPDDATIRVALSRH